MLKILFFTFVTLLTPPKIEGKVTEHKIKSIYFTMVEYPPYLTSHEGKHRGLIVDVIYEALKTQGVKFDFRLMSYARAVKEAVDGNSDGTISNLIFISEEDQKRLYRKNRYITFMEALLFKKKRFPKAPSGYKDNVSYFDGKRVEAVKNTNMHIDESRVQFSSHRTMEGMLKKLELDRIDFAIVTHLNVIDYFLKNKIKVAQYSHTKINTSGSYAFFSKKRPDYELKADILEKGIWTIMANGTYAELVKHYYGGQLPPYTVWPTTKDFIPEILY